MTRVISELQDAASFLLGRKLDQMFLNRKANKLISNQGRFEIQSLFFYWSFFLLSPQSSPPLHPLETTFRPGRDTHLLPTDSDTKETRVDQPGWGRVHCRFQRHWRGKTYQIFSSIKGKATISLTSNCIHPSIWLHGRHISFHVEENKGIPERKGCRGSHKTTWRRKRR